MLLSSVLLTVQHHINTNPSVAREFFYVQRITRYVPNSGLLGWRSECDSNSFIPFSRFERWGVN